MNRSGPTADAPNEYRLALVGDPVEHSRSPAIQTAALAMAGLAGSYVAIRCDPSGLGQVMERLRGGDLHGVNVTMPLKVLALAMCDVTTPEASQAGSANTLRIGGGLVEGHSTDVEAFRRIYSSVDLSRPLLVLGGGGSASAAVAAWPGSRVSVSVRDQVRSDRLGGIDLTPWGDPVQDSILVNATPLGMHGEVIPFDALQACSLLIDLPYRPGETPAVIIAKELGKAVCDGIEFLGLQAAHSFEWWTGHTVDSEVLIRVARNV